MADRLCVDCGTKFEQGVGRPAQRCAACRPVFSRRRATEWYRANPERHRETQKRLRGQRRAGDRSPCDVPGCSRQRAYGDSTYCSMHRYRVKRHGAVGPAESVREVRNNRTPQGYVRRRINGRAVLEHRWTVEQQIGRPLWPWEYVHHMNGRKDDNRPDNLEIWITPQPKGQRPDDIAAWLVEHYPEAVQRALRGQKEHSHG